MREDRSGTDLTSRIIAPKVLIRKMHISIYVVLHDPVANFRI